MTKGCAAKRAAKTAAGLPIALTLSLGLAYAQGSSTTTVTKTVTVPPSGAALPPAQETLRPTIGQDVIPADNAAPGDEIVPAQIDEGASWQVAVQESEGPTPLIGKQQTDAVSQINAYFNAMTDLEGDFLQIDASNKKSKGRFYVNRPGKIRFEYAPPSPLLIIADGHSLGIQDKSLKTLEKYPIRATPFRLLLVKNVNLGRDAKIVGVERSNGTLALTLEDRKGTAGHIRLVFKDGAKLQLTGWTITDAQGLTTRVTVNNLVAGRKRPGFKFKFKDAPNQPFRMGG